MNALIATRRPFVWKDEAYHWYARVWLDGQTEVHSAAQKAIRTALVARDLIALTEEPRVIRTDLNDEFADFRTRQTYKPRALTFMHTRIGNLGETVVDTHTGAVGTLVGWDASRDRPILYVSSYGQGWFSVGSMDRLRRASYEQPSIRYPRVGDTVVIRRGNYGHGHRSYPGLREGLRMTVTRSLDPDRLRHSEVAARSRTGRNTHIIDVRDLVVEIPSTR